MSSDSGFESAAAMFPLGSLTLKRGKSRSSWTRRTIQGLCGPWILDISASQSDVSRVLEKAESLEVKHNSPLHRQFRNLFQGQCHEVKTPLRIQQVHKQRHFVQSPTL